MTVMALSPFRFQCQLCGVCCRGHAMGIPLYIRDVFRLSRYLNLPIEQFLTEYCCLHHVVESEKSVPVLFLKQVHGHCPFLKQNQCEIHRCKPYLCKKAPVIAVLLESSALMEVFKETCPGYGRGKMISGKAMSVSIQKEHEMEIVDKTAYQQGWYTQLLSILNKEV